MRLQMDLPKSLLDFMIAPLVAFDILFVPLRFFSFEIGSNFFSAPPAEISVANILLQLRTGHVFFVTKQRIELNPCHVGLGDKGHMASRTFGRRRFRGGLC
jgi:hypothetical protein